LLCGGFSPKKSRKGGAPCQGGPRFEIPCVLNWEKEAVPTPLGMNMGREIRGSLLLTKSDGHPRYQGEEKILPPRPVKYQFDVKGKYSGSFPSSHPSRARSKCAVMEDQELGEGQGGGKKTQFAHCPPRKNQPYLQWTPQNPGGPVQIPGSTFGKDDMCRTTPTQRLCEKAVMGKKVSKATLKKKDMLPEGGGRP